MPYFSIWSKNSGGRINRIVHCAREMIQLQLRTNEDFIEGYFLDTDYYIKDGKVVNRPRMSPLINKTSIIANGTDKVTISGIPKGTTVTGTNIENTTVDDGTLEFTTEVPGKYILKFENFPYQEMEVEIDAT